MTSSDTPGSSGPSQAPSTEPLYEDTLPGGCHWSLVMKRGHQLRLIDKEGGANVGMLFYNPGMLLERINLPDTLKCQHTFKLTRGHCIYSDMGRIFCSITEDSLGWHDAAGGTCNRRLVERKWGKKTFQDAHNDYHRNGYDSFLVQLAKYGLGKKDLAANINFFSKVATSDEGAMSFVPGHSKAGDSVTLRFEMDTLVIFHACPHPMDNAEQYPVKPVTYQISKAPAVADDDVCKNACDENQRGFMNNALYHLQG
ncbi:MAG: urea carboxylase-associated family protein [Ketobacteraceae bacterium]|nr:urea carboxylase-associated family protein [Ketobacteraceae bacterium]